MEYIVRRPFRWQQKDMKKGETITSQNSDEARRLNILAGDKIVIPVVEEEFYHKLDAAGVRMGRIVRKQEEEVSNEKKKRAKEN